MLINGAWLNDTRTFPVFNPATGEEIGRVADGTEQDAARAIDAASAALPSWMNETAYARSAVLYRAYQLMLEQQRELAELMTREQGKPLKASMNEVKYAADFLLWFAEEAKRGVRRDHSVCAVRPAFSGAKAGRWCGHCCHTLELPDLHVDP